MTDNNNEINDYETFLERGDYRWTEFDRIKTTEGQVIRIMEYSYSENVSITREFNLTDYENDTDIIKDILEWIECRVELCTQGLGDIFDIEHRFKGLGDMMLFFDLVHKCDNTKEYIKKKDIDNKFYNSCEAWVCTGEYKPNNEITFFKGRIVVEYMKNKRVSLMFKNYINN